MRGGEGEESLARAAVKKIDAELGVGCRQRLHHRELDIENVGERRPVGFGGQNAVRNAHLAHCLREQGIDVPHILAVERFLGEIIEDRVVLAREGRLQAREKHGVIGSVAGDLFLDRSAGKGERFGRRRLGRGGTRRRLGARRFRRLPSGVEEKGHRQRDGDQCCKAQKRQTQNVLAGEPARDNWTLFAVIRFGQFRLLQPGGSTGVVYEGRI